MGNPRTVQDIEADIQAIKADIQAIRADIQTIKADIQTTKDGNPDWFKDAGDMALIKSFNDSIHASLNVIIIKRERIGTASGESQQKLVSQHKITFGTPDTWGFIQLCSHVYISIRNSATPSMKNMYNVGVLVHGVHHTLPVSQHYPANVNWITDPVAMALITSLNSLLAELLSKYGRSRASGDTFFLTKIYFFVV